MTLHPDAIPPDALLTLAMPRSLEEEVLDTLMAHPDLATGFTVHFAEGMGIHVELATAMEQVQGRARRVIVQIALARERLPALVALLRQELQNPAIAYWVSPLIAFGRMGEAQS